MSNFHMVIRLPNPAERPIPTPAGDANLLQKEAKQDATKYYTDPKHAAEVAAHLAARNPKVQYAVLSVTKVMETVEPQVITKVLNDAGELVVEKA